MKTISIRKSAQWAMDNQDSIRRVARNVKVIYSVTRYGSRALTKINPVTVYFDAILSVFEAATAYANYRRAVEQTKQLALELETCQKEFENLKAQYEELLETERVKIERHIKKIKAEIDVQRERQSAFKMVYEQTGKHLEMIKRLIIEQRKNYMYDDDIRDLEKKYVEAIHVRMEIAIQIIGG